MKFKLKITKKILQDSMLCGTNEESVGKNCAFARAFNELIPNVAVGIYHTYFGTTPDGNYFAKVNNTNKQTKYILAFDSLKSIPNERLKLPEQEFEVEIPDCAIDHYYKDEVAFAQALANTPVFEKV